MELYWVVVFAVILNSIWGILYIKDTLSWKTKPNKITWWIWAAAPLIWSFATFYSEWFVWSAIPVFMAGFIPLLIFISSFLNKKSYWKLWKLDYICLIFAILAIILWLITNNPLLAIIFWISADFLAAIPILIKIYKYPETETVLPFIAGLIANWSSFLVIKNWEPEEYLFPLYLVSICLLLIIAYYKNNIIKFIKSLT